MIRTHISTHARIIRITATTIGAVLALAWIGWLPFALGLTIGAVLGSWITADLAADRAHAAHARGFTLGIEVGAHEQAAGIHHHDPNTYPEEDVTP